MDRGAWQATVHRVTRSQTWLKQLGTHTHVEYLQHATHSVLKQSCDVHTIIISTCQLNKQAERGSVVFSRTQIITVQCSDSGSLTSNTYFNHSTTFYVKYLRQCQELSRCSINGTTVIKHINDISKTIFIL